MDTKLSADGRELTVAHGPGVTNSLMVATLMEKQVPAGTVPAAGVCPSVASGGELTGEAGSWSNRLCVADSAVIQQDGVAPKRAPVCHTLTGYYLGGGMGMAAPLIGLGCDRIVELEMVLANGSVVVANAGARLLCS